MTAIVRNFHHHSLPGDPAHKTALLLNPPVYDTQYWAKWSQPYGLLKIGALLRQLGYRRIVLFDFMEPPPGGKRKVKQHRINPEESYGEQDEPSRPTRPYVVEKGQERLELFKFHFGRTWADFDDWLAAQGFSAGHGPDEIFISAVMTYWWEPVRDLTVRLRRRFPASTIILGGIYPTLVPEHAARHTAANLVVAGEVEEANDLWTDLSLYEQAPDYAIITPGRGCPHNCAYCAQQTINNGRRKPQFRAPEDIVAEMRHKHETYGIRDFAFYADYLLWHFEDNFQRVLELVVRERLPFRLYAPEGLDVALLSRSQQLLDLMKEAHFEKIYLPCESIDEGFPERMNRKHVHLEHFVRAAQMCERAGFRMRNLEVNAFVMYGLPGETIDSVVKTTLFVSEVVGSVIPMLFTPVPATAIYKRYFPYFRERGWHEELHMLNGKLYPFLELNEGSLSDYIDLQRLMYMLNAHYRSQSFRVFGDTLVSRAFRENLNNGFGEFVRNQSKLP